MSSAASFFTPVLNAVAGASQTQADVKELADTAKAVQSPQFQEQVETAKTAGVAYAGLTLLFQGVAAAALVYIAYKMSQKKGR